MKDVIRVAVALTIAAGVTWWMLRKEGELATKPRELSEFQMKAIKRNKDKILKQAKRLRKAKPIPW